MVQQNKLTILLLVIISIIMILLSGCGSSSPTGANNTGSGAGGGITITGTVQAPNGQIAYESNTIFSKIAKAIAQEAYALVGLMPVGNATVTIQMVDNSGNPLLVQPAGLPITVTANASGTYSITLPAGITYSPQLVAGVFNGPASMSSVVAGPVTNITPVTQAVITLLAANGGLSNYSVVGVNDITNTVEIATTNTPSTMSVNTTVQNIIAAAQANPAVNTSITNNGGWNNIPPPPVNPALKGGNIIWAPLNLTSQNANVTTLAATLNNPEAVTTDGTNLYIAERSGVVKKVVIATNQVTMLASGLGNIRGITTDGINLYVTDSSRNLIYQISMAGTVTTFAGTGAIGLIDGVGTAAAFNYPVGITTDGTSLYIADNGNNVIREINIATKQVTILSGSINGTPGAVDHVGTQARLNAPWHITTDGSNFLYFTDMGNQAVRKIKIGNVIGRGEVLTIAGTVGIIGSQDSGLFASAKFNQPAGITIDGSYLYVSDRGNHKIRRIIINPLVGTVGWTTTIAGPTWNVSGFTDGIGTSALFNTPQGLASDGISLYLADVNNGSLRKITNAGVMPPPPPPAAPVNLSATPGANSTLVLNWNTVAGATGYNVYVAYAPNTPIGANTLLNRNGAVLNAPINMVAIPGVVYYIKVTALNGTVESAASGEIMASIPIVLQPPTGVSATATGSTQINVSWALNASASYYNIYRSTVSGFAISGATKIGSAAAGPFGNTGLTPATTYYYKVTAVDVVNGESAPSLEVMATTTAIVQGGTNPPPKPAAGGLANNWQVQVDNSINFGVSARSPSLYVVSSGGIIYTSVDGISWTKSATLAPWMQTERLIWTGTQFVLTGSGGIFTSADGITWTNRYAAGGVIDITWSGTQFVATDASGIITSPDGITWTQRAAGMNGALTWNGTQFVLVGASTSTSVDGITWTTAGNNLAGISPLLASKVIWTGTKYIAIGGSIYQKTIFTSADGITWTSVAAGATTISDISWSGTQAVAVTSYTGNVLTSPDGVTWTTRTTGVIGIANIIWSGGQYIATGSSGGFMTSADGISWAQPRRNGSFPANNISSVATSGNIYIAVGATGLVGRSTDGITWTSVKLGLDYINRVIWTGTQFVAVGQQFPSGAYVITSSDGISWTQRSVTNPSGLLSGPLTSVVWTGTQFVATATNGMVISTDGISWVYTQLPVMFSDIAWSGTQYVAVGSFGSISTSADGINWITRTSGTTNTLYKIVWSGTEYVIAGDLGTVLTSADGITWTIRTSGTTARFVDIVWTGTKYVAVGDATVLSSADGITWSPSVLTNISAGTGISGITWSGTQFVAVGSSGIILTSQ